MKKKSWKPELDSSWVTYARIGFNQLIYALYVQNHTAPIGFVWGRGYKRSQELDVFFLERPRKGKR